MDYGDRATSDQHTTGKQRGKLTLLSNKMEQPEEDSDEEEKGEGDVVELAGSDS